MEKDERKNELFVLFLIDEIHFYYFTDIGLRNARLNFRQTEENHIMENIIFNELVHREFDVDVGMVEAYTNDEQEKRIRQQLEIDF